MHLPSAVLLISLPALGISLAVPKQLNDNIMRRSPPPYSVVNVDGESNPPPSPESSMIESSSPSSATPTVSNTPTPTLTPIVTPCASKTPASSTPASSTSASSSFAVSRSVAVSSSAPYPSSSASSVPIAEDGFGGEFNAPYDNGFAQPSASAYGGGGSDMRFSNLRARDLTG